MTPMNGWCLVRRSQLADQYAGSRLIVPESVKERVARWQYEVVTVAWAGTRCVEEDCEREHVHSTAKFHVRPSVKNGDWVLTLPRSLVEIPGTDEQWVVPIESLLAVLEDE